MSNPVLTLFLIISTSLIYGLSPIAAAKPPGRCPQVFELTLQYAGKKTYADVPFTVSDFSYYEKHARQELEPFIKWIKENRPDVITLAVSGAKKYRTIKQLPYYSMLTDTPENELRFLEYLSPAQWRSLDEAYLSDLKTRLLELRPKLKSLLDGVEKERVLDRHVITFNGKEYKNAVLLGEAAEGLVYRVNHSGKQKVIKIYRWHDQFDWAHRAYNTLHTAGAPSARVLDIDVNNKSILLEYVHGISMENLKSAEAKGVLPEGTVRRFETILQRTITETEKTYGPKITAANPKGTLNFIPHSYNWILDLEKDKFILIDPR